MPIIAVANQKGGVGKSTTSINLSAALAQLGYEAVLVDMDPQGNSTSTVSVPKTESTVYDVLMENCGFTDVIVPTQWENLYCVPASLYLAKAEVELNRKIGFDERLSTAIKAADLPKGIWVILDCPPSLGILTLNALTAADYVLIPLEADAYSVDGVAALQDTIADVKKWSNPDLSTIGALLCRFDRRANISFEVLEAVKSVFGEEIVFKHPIGQDAQVRYAAEQGKPVVYYNAGARATVDYMKLAREVIKRAQ